MGNKPKQNISRRQFLRMSAGAAAGAALVSCAPASPAPEKAAEEPAVAEEEAQVKEEVPAAEKVTITYWDWWGLTTGLTAQMFEALVSDFAEIEPNIELNLQNVPFGEYFRKFLAAHAAGDVPDTMHCSTSWSRDFWDEGALVDLVPYMEQTSDAREQDFIPITLFAARKGPAIYGVPGEGPDHRTIFLNVGYFEEAGLTTDLKEIQDDWDWNTFTEAAKELTILEGEDFKRSGFLVGTPGYADIDTWAGCHGVESYKYEGDEIVGVAFNDKKACVNGLYWYLDMLYDSKVSQPIGPERQDWNQFVQGTTAMVSSGPWNYGRIIDEAPDMNWSAMLYPQAPVEGGHYSTEIWTNMLSIPAKAKEKENGWKLLHYWCGLDFMLRRLEIGKWMAPREDFYETAEYQAERQKLPVLNNILVAMEVGAGEMFIRQSAVDSISAPIMEAVMLRERDVEGAVEELLTEIGSLMAEAGYGAG